MASRQQIKRRIGSVKSTKQITKAMQLVAASKLRRAQDAAFGPQAYAAMARQILARLRQLADDDTEYHLFSRRAVKSRMLIVITSDRTLAGAYNANVIRKMVAEVKADREKGIETSVICVGRQGANAASRISDLEVEAIYTGMPDQPDANALRPILNSIVTLFAKREVDAVDLITTKFISTVTQTVELRRLLPAGQEADEQEVVAELANAEAEPSAEALLRATTIRLLEAQIYQAVLDSVASEHSMRMLAMKSATDNATEIIDDLTLEFNNARQAAITQELAEITGGAEAIK